MTVLNEDFMFPDKWMPALKAVCAQHELDIEHSGHGLHHWLRVMDIGLDLCKKVEGADPDIIIGFALFHDSARTHDHHCEQHGPDAVNVINKYADLIPLDNSQMLELQIACVNHTTAHPGEFPILNPSILVCFDSDSLDLWRVGIVPDNAYLFTDAAKDKELQNGHNDRAWVHAIPYWANEIYFEVLDGE